MNGKWSRYRYLRKVKDYLPCNAKQKKQILSTIRVDLMAYMQVFPDAGYAQLVERFGEPSRIAAAYVDEMDTDSLLTALRIKRKLVTAVVVMCLTFAALWAGALSYQLYYNAMLANGYTVVILEEGEVFEDIQEPWER